VSEATSGRDFREQVAAAYGATGVHHLLPFIGARFERPSHDALRVAVVGINSYIKANHWKAPDEMRGWFAGWWTHAGCGEARRTWPYYTRAFRESDILARALSSASQLFAGLHYDSSPTDKNGYYATNAIKTYLQESAGKLATDVPDELIREHARVWHAELDLMAEFGVLPHLVVCFGQKLWDSMWRAFSFKNAATFPSYRNLEVLRFDTAGEDDDPVYHRATAMTLEAGERSQNCLLVRLDHPATRTAAKKQAAWLLAQPTFRTLAQLGD